jgi:acyl transferase domain-containing protein/acyl carrier protein
VAVHLACQSLLNEECDMALAGGISINVKQRNGYRYIEGAMESPDGHCRAFDAKAQGTLFGCGTGVVVLKRLKEALEDGDNVLAVIRGSAVNNDGSLKVGFTAPSVTGQAEVISEALSVADCAPDTISYIEAHGTGTALGDPIEIQALTKAFRAGTARRQFCGIGSVKTNLGHLEAAAGVTGLIKTVLALQHRQIPPSLNFEKPNPRIDFENSPFYVNDRLRDWPEVASQPRRAGVSSFGFGGTNAHLIVEEASLARPSDPAPGGGYLLLLSARTQSALDAATVNLLNHLKNHPEQSLADVAYTLQVGRKSFNQRRFLVCQDRREALAQLEKGNLASSTGKLENSEAPVVFLFPGQGSQRPGMAQEFYQNIPFFREQVDRCSRLLRPLLGLELTGLLYPAPDQLEAARQRLNQTALAQPALFVIEYALARLWQSWGVQPQALAGHSVGEYVAATLAGVFSLEGALKLIAIRGKLMQEMPGGVMLAVPLSEGELQPYLNPALSIASLNGPHQSVVAGPEEAIARLEGQLSQQEVVIQRLRTSHAFHSAMMEPVVERFAAEVARVRRNPPRLPYLSNLTGQWIKPAEAVDPQYWARHLRQPVRFSQNLEILAQNPAQVLLEVGPGQSLGKLARRHPALSAKQVVLASLPDLRPALPLAAGPAYSYWSVLGNAWLAGVKLDWQAVYRPGRRQRVALPPYPFERQSYWVAPLKSAYATEAAPALEPETEDAAPVKLDPAEWFYQPTWRNCPLPPGPAGQAEFTSAPWLIFLDRAGLGLKLSERLRQAGQPVTTVGPGPAFSLVSSDSYLICPGQAGDYQLLFEALGEAGLPGRVIYLGYSGATTPAEPARPGPAYGFRELVYLAQALANRAVQLEIITSQLVDVSGNEEISPEKSPLLGLVRVIGQEQPALRCRLVDLVAGANLDSLAGRLVLELQAEVCDLLVAYRGRQRWVLDYAPVKLADPPAGRHTGKVYLITEGLNNIGWELAQQLASHSSASLVLTGTEPDEAKISWLQSQGGRVVFAQTPATNGAGLAAAVELACRRFGGLDGVIHAAPSGLAEGRRFEPISALDPAQAEQSFEACRQSLAALEMALPARLELDFCLVVSSLAVVLGGKGFGAYAAINALLDSYVHRHNQVCERPWLVVNWDAWQTGQTGLQITNLNSKLAQLALSPSEGYESFNRLVQANLTEQVVISTGPLDRRLHEASRNPADQPLTTEQAQTLHPRPELANLYVAAETDLEKQVAAIWQKALGYDRVGLHDNFFELGGESLAALQVISQLKKELKVNLPAASLYERLTINSLVELIQNENEAGGAEEMLLSADREFKVNRRKQFQEDQRSRRKRD